MMRVGFDYWQVISHYPTEMGQLCDALHEQGWDVHVISAIGKNRVGTIADDVHQHWPTFPKQRIHEVIFTNGTKSSPAIKLAKCKELGITMFFDDRKDVCELLSANGILAFQVPRKGAGTDIGAERV